MGGISDSPLVTAGKLTYYNAEFKDFPNFLKKTPLQIMIIGNCDYWGPQNHTDIGYVRSDYCFQPDGVNSAILLAG